MPQITLDGSEDRISILGISTILPDSKLDQDHSNHGTTKTKKALYPIFNFTETIQKYLPI